MSADRAPEDQDLRSLARIVSIPRTTSSDDAAHRIEALRIPGRSRPGPMIHDPFERSFSSAQLVRLFICAFRDHGTGVVGDRSLEVIELFFHPDLAEEERPSGRRIAQLLDSSWTKQGAVRTQGELNRPISAARDAAEKSRDLSKQSEESVLRKRKVLQDLSLATPISDRTVLVDEATSLVSVTALLITASAVVRDSRYAPQVFVGLDPRHNHASELIDVASFEGLVKDEICSMVAKGRSLGRYELLGRGEEPHETLPGSVVTQDVAHVGRSVSHPHYGVGKIAKRLKRDDEQLHRLGLLPVKFHGEVVSVSLASGRLRFA